MRRSAPPLIGLLLASTVILAPPLVPLAGAPKSVLFLVIDDFRPELSAAYGQRRLITPNLDKFAQSALTFGHAYVQFAHCSPSRNSFLSGRSPQTTQVYNFVEHFREVGKNWTALPQFFKQNGYYSAGGGKVYHPNLPPNNDPPSWDVYFYANGDDRGCN
jgi:arylsulfatase A-like enzyme